MGTPRSEEEEVLHGITNIHEKTAAHGGPTQKQKKRVRKKKEQGETAP